MSKTTTKTQAARKPAVKATAKAANDVAGKTSRKAAGKLKGTGASSVKAAAKVARKTAGRVPIKDKDKDKTARAGATPLSVPLHSTAPVQRPRKADKPTRAEKGQQTRAALLQAAAEVIGEHGYQGAMVSLITAKAQIAQGTFYNYFASQQELLDQLLPALGRFMLGYIQERVADAKTEAEREERRFEAYFAFLEEHPEFYRIMYEAEVFAPAAFRQHRETVGRGLTGLLQRASKSGGLIDCEPRELEVLAYMLMGARHYLSMRYARDGDRPAKFPKWVTKAYMKFLANGVFA